MPVTAFDVSQLTATSLRSHLVSRILGMRVDVADLASDLPDDADDRYFRDRAGKCVGVAACRVLMRDVTYVLVEATSVRDVVVATIWTGTAALPATDSAPLMPFRTLVLDDSSPEHAREFRIDLDCPQWHRTEAEAHTGHARVVSWLDSHLPEPVGPAQR